MTLREAVIELVRHRLEIVIKRSLSSIRMVITTVSCHPSEKVIDHEVIVSLFLTILNLKQELS
jgi:hypothetical protein